MARLPVPGSDQGTWGDILNDFLSQSLNADGTIKAGAISSKADDNAVVKLTGAQTVAGVKTFSSSPVVPTPSANTDAANKAYVDATASSGTPDADASTKGKIQLAGDLTGTAASPAIANNAITDAKVNSSAAIAQSKIANLTTDLSGKQPLDSDLTAIASLSPTNDDIMQRKGGVWTNRTTAQLKTDLSLTKSDVGLGNVDNTSDATKNSASATLTNKTISGSSNTLSNIPESAVTNLTSDLASKKTDSMATNKLLGRGTAGTGAIEEITLGNNLSLSGTTLNATNPGGDVVGPASATDNAVTRYDGTTGKLVQDSNVTIDDNGRVTVPTGSTGGVVFGADVNLYRSAANILKTDDQLQASVAYFSPGANQTGIGNVGPSGNAGVNFGIAADTNLYRSAADTLKTDDTLIVGTAGTAAGSAVTIDGTQTLTNKTLTSPAISTPTGLVKGDIGLGNVDNTSDANKPVSTATQTALDGKVDESVLTTKGDIYAATAASTPARVGIGSNGTSLIADSSQSAGMKYVEMTRCLRVVLDGGGAAITTGAKKVYLTVPFDCTITKVRLLADVSGSIVLDIWNDTYANFPPTVADTITASAKPTLSAAQKSEDATLTGWSKDLSAGNILEINVDSASTITKVFMDLFVRPR